MEAYFPTENMEVTRAALRVAGRALARAVADVSGGDVLEPLAMYETDGGAVKVARFTGRTMREAVDAGRNHLAKVDAVHWAFLFDGYLPTDSGRVPALYLQLKARPWAEPAVVALRYRIKTARSRFAVLGDPVLARPTSHRLEMDALLEGAAEEPDAMEIWARALVR